MPPLPRLRVAALADLLGQLRFASREALLRDLARAEALASEIDPAALYDEAWLVRRITAYAAELDDPATLVGQAVLADLSSFVERLCVFASLTPSDVPEGSLGIQDLASRWNISRKTIDRYRRRGLIARRVSDRPGRAWLVFTPDAVAAFEARRGSEIARASTFSRIDAATTERMLRRARRYRRRFRASLNEVALRLSGRFDRSHEAVRQVLQRHDRESADPIFAPGGPISDRESRLLLRGSDRGLEPSLMARHLRRSAPVVRRAINLARLDRLRHWIDAEPAPEIDAALLSSEWVTKGLGAPGPTDLADLFEEARRVPPPRADVERARALAQAALRRRAAAALAEISAGSPQAALLDRAETDLRWAGRLLAELVRSQWPSITRAMTTRLGRPPEELRPSQLRDLVQRIVSDVSRAVMEFDPAAGGRLAARVSLATDRVCERWLREHPRSPESGIGRATSRLPAGVPVADFTRAVAPWQPALDLAPRLVRILGAASAETQRTLELRFGLGDRPVTLDELASTLGISRLAAPRAERKALREIRRLAREAGEKAQRPGS